MTSPRKILLSGIAAAALVGALAGCSSASDDTGGKIELRVATFPPGADTAA